MGQGRLTQTGLNQAMLQLGGPMAFGGQDGIDPTLADPLFQPAMLVGQCQLASWPVFGHQIADEDDDGTAAADRLGYLV